MVLEISSLPMQKLLAEEQGLIRLGTTTMSTRSMRFARAAETITSTRGADDIISSGCTRSEARSALREYKRWQSFGVCVLCNAALGGESTMCKWRS